MQSVVYATNDTHSMRSTTVRMPLAVISSRGGQKRARSASNDAAARKEVTVKALKTELVPSAQPEASILSQATWNRIQSMIIAAKSLRSITRVVLAFFKEHEIAHTSRSRTPQVSTYPIAISISEVYTMLAPRKRRVYDVLHVLEGVGVLKRVRGENAATSRFKGGYFLFFGKAGVLERLKAIQTRTRAISVEAMHKYKDLTRHQLDTILLGACSLQSKIEGWPHLATMTVSLLSLVLESRSSSGGDAMVMQPLSEISRRLVESRLACEENVAADKLHVEVNRRVYDVVSVLATLNVLLLSCLSETQKKDCGRRRGYATPRKGVTFNAAILSNASLLRVGDACSSHLEKALRREKIAVQAAKDKSAQAGVGKRGGTVKSEEIPLARVLEDEEDAASPMLEDLFPSVNPSMDCTENLVEWWNAPLRDLLLRDALPRVDFLDWQIMQAISRSRQIHESANPSKSAVHEQPPAEEEIDLECHEELAE